MNGLRWLYLTTQLDYLQCLRSHLSILQQRPRYKLSACARNLQYLKKLLRIIINNNNLIHRIKENVPRRVQTYKVLVLHHFQMQWRSVARRSSLYREKGKRLVRGFDMSAIGW
jgi:hypothetical protein